MVKTPTATGTAKSPQVKGKPVEAKNAQPPPPSPPRKTSVKRQSNHHLDKLSSANMIKWKKVGIDDLAVALIYKPDGIGPAFTGNIMGHIEDNPERMEFCKILMITNLRNPNGENEILETENKQGNKYPHILVVISTNENVSINEAVSNLAKTMNNIAKTECDGEWKFGIPFFVNKGEATPQTILPLSYYLLNEECVTVMKRIFENCETKDDLLNNDYTEPILSSVFGDAVVGQEIITGMFDELYNEL
jgi:hypothetical protein